MCLHPRDLIALLKSSSAIHFLLLRCGRQRCFIHVGKVPQLRSSSKTDWLKVPCFHFIPRDSVSSNIKTQMFAFTVFLKFGVFDTTCQCPGFNPQGSQSFYGHDFLLLCQLQSFQTTPSPGVWSLCSTCHVYFPKGKPKLPCPPNIHCFGKTSESITSGFTEFRVHAAHAAKGSNHQSESSLHVAFD